MFILNLFVWAQASSTAIPFSTLISLIALWLLIQLPLVYIGSWVGYRYRGAYQHPIAPNATPRQLPAQSSPWAHMGIWHPVSALFPGLVPFFVIFIELMFVFQNLWQDKSGFYYMYGFLAVVSALLVVTVVEVTIVAVYWQLSSEVRPCMMSDYTLTVYRTTTGGGSHFLSGRHLASGSSSIASTTTSISYTLLDSCRASYSSAIRSWHARCMVF